MARPGEVDAEAVAVKEQALVALDAAVQHIGRLAGLEVPCHQRVDQGVEHGVDRQVRQIPGQERQHLVSRVGGQVGALQVGEHGEGQRARAAVVKEVPPIAAQIGAAQQVPDELPAELSVVGQVGEHRAEEKGRRLGLGGRA